MKRCRTKFASSVCAKYLTHFEMTREDVVKETATNYPIPPSRIPPRLHGDGAGVGRVVWSSCQLLSPPRNSIHDITPVPCTLYHGHHANYCHNPVIVFMPSLLYPVLCTMVIMPTTVTTP